MEINTIDELKKGFLYYSDPDRTEVYGIYNGTEMDNNGNQLASFTDENGKTEKINILRMNYHFPLYERNIGGKKRKQKSYNHKTKHIKTKTNKTHKIHNTKLSKYGGKTTSIGSHVELTYDNKPLFCSNCQSNDYDEIIGTIDNTSIITYFCNTCGLCRMIRNKDPLMITSTIKS